MTAAISDVQPAAAVAIAAASTAAHLIAAAPAPESGRIALPLLSSSAALALTVWRGKCLSLLTAGLAVAAGVERAASAVLRRRCRLDGDLVDLQADRAKRPCDRVAVPGKLVVRFLRLRPKLDRQAVAVEAQMSRYDA